MMKKANKDDATKKEPVEDNRQPYSSIIRENEKFVQYYEILVGFRGDNAEEAAERLLSIRIQFRTCAGFEFASEIFAFAQGVCPKEEFQSFLTYLKTDLPSTFRITGSKEVARKMLEHVDENLIKDCIKQEGEEKPPVIFPLSWYPDKLAWQMELTRKDIRRCEAFYKLHNFLISETENGTISRQETVSMIPPLLLDVQPHHKVLDMCAAPGSKTAQLLEMLHKNNDVPIPSGYVVANDVDNKRCYMLVHQAKRLNSPCVAIINHDSASLPNIFKTLADGSTIQIQFDRILCDVPCSGDGTLRKNPDIWMKWTPANALNLHGIQYRILRRGVELLSIGGKIVYSTCSINPIENEAVIRRMLEKANGALELLDISQALPGLKYAPGMESWKVSSRNLEWYSTFEEVDGKWQTTIRPQMFPPSPKERSKYNLDRCMRILPQHQNTGAFFVAVLQKINPFTASEKAFQSTLEGTKNKTMEEEIAEAKKRENEDRLPQNQRKRRRKDGFREDPYVFFEEDEPVWQEIKSFYEISNDFPSNCLLTRCREGKKKNIYLTSPAVRDLLNTNQGHIKFINTGVKAWVRCDNKNMKCAFRMANDGLESIYPYIGESRKLTIPKEDLMQLLMKNDPKNSPPITSLSEFVQEQTEKISPGSCILIYTEQMKNIEQPLVLHISGWRGKTSLRCYMTQHSTVHLLRILGGDVSKYDVNKFKKTESEVAVKDEDEEGQEEINEEAMYVLERPEEVAEENSLNAKSEL